VSKWSRCSELCSRVCQ